MFSAVIGSVSAKDVSVLHQQLKLYVDTGYIARYTRNFLLFVNFSPVLIWVNLEIVFFYFNFVLDGGNVKQFLIPSLHQKEMRGNFFSSMASKPIIIRWIRTDAQPY